MEEGVIFIGKKTLFKVVIDGRGGDSTRTEYFETSDDATLASAVDGKNRTPQPIEVMEFSDGTFLIGDIIFVSPGPSAKRRIELLDSLTLAQKILLNRRDW